MYFLARRKQDTKNKKMIHKVDVEKIKRPILMENDV
jgi:hypothetical protein